MDNNKVMLRYRRFAITPLIVGLMAIASVSLCLIHFYSQFPDWKQERLLRQKEVAKEAILTLIDDIRLDLEYALTRKRFTITIMVATPKLVNSVQVYSGSYEGPLGDPRYGERRFSKAKLVAEKCVDSSGEVSFVLKPGRYFIYPVINYEHELARKGSYVHLGAFPNEVYLDRDMEITPKFFVSH